MEQYLNGYKQFLENLSMSPHTVKQYVLDAKHFVQYWQLQEEQPFSKVLVGYRNHLCENYDAARSINRKLAGTRKFVLFLYDRAYITAFDDTQFEPIEQQQITLHVLSQNEIDTIYKALQMLIHHAADEEQQFLAARHNAMFTLFIKTSIKPIECVHMKWEHISEEYLIIPQKLTPRSIEMPTELFNKLQKLREASNVIFSEQSFVWLGLGNKRGSAITEKTVERFFKMLSDLVGFKVTATICRYTVIATLEKSAYETSGYSRKDVLQERLNKIKID